MRNVDMETWPRREHYKYLSTWGYPHFSICANVDITSFYAAVKHHGISINVEIVYILARAANAITEFRYRIRGEEVVEHEVVHPSTTIMGEQDLFTFCTFDYYEEFSIFAEKAQERITYMQVNPSVESDLDLDELLYMTAIP